MKLKGLFIAATLLMPTAALAAPGIVTTAVSLRSGLGEGFPTVDRIPVGAGVNIHGCLRGTAWCDVSWRDDRGWVSSQYLEYLYRDHYVYLPDYVGEIDVPVVPFVLTSYWSRYYAGRPWYHRRTYWSGYWQSHERFATRLTIDRSAARIGRAAAARDATLPEARLRVGVMERTEGGTRENRRMTRERAIIREQSTVARSQTPPIMALGHDEPRAIVPRIERAPPRMAQPSGAPHINVAPRDGSGPAGGGSHDQDKHR